MKTIFFLALAAAMLPGIKAAQNALAGYQHMQATAAMMADPFVARDYDRFRACAAAAQSEARAIAGDTDHRFASVDADPSQCRQAGANPRWVAVR